MGFFFFRFFFSKKRKNTANLKTRGFSRSPTLIAIAVPLHTVFILIIPLLIELLQVEYQNKDVPPFDKHPVNMWIFFIAACIYGLGLSINMEENRANYYSDLISNVILSSGALASVSLASVFLPRFLGWLCLALWTIFPFMLTNNLIQHFYEWFKHVTMTTISQAWNRFNRFWGCFSLNNRSLPM